MFEIPSLLKAEMHKKFEKGRREHGNGWESIDHKKELLDECYDGMNYLEGLKDYNSVKDCEKIQHLFIQIWKLTGKLQVNPLLQ